MQHVAAARLRQGANEECVPDVAGRLLPAAFLQIGDDCVEHGPLVALGHEMRDQRDRVGALAGTLVRECVRPGVVVLRQVGRRGPIPQ